MSVALLSTNTNTNPNLSVRPGSRPQRSPPRNLDGEITCTHEECKNEQRTFRRLCEYNKHMDKHERPYKCNNPACRKNPGFTYAGGLLRHQREVHSMHRTKDPFFCPHMSCNRSSGSGFSRRENLEEHLRRRHSGISIDDTTESTAGTEPRTPQHQQPHPHLHPQHDLTQPRQHQQERLEPLQPNRKRRMDSVEAADDAKRGLDPETHESLRTRITMLQQDNDHMRNELFRRDQLLTDMAQENKRLRSMFSTQLPPLPPQHAMYHPPPLG